MNWDTKIYQSNIHTKIVYFPIFNQSKHIKSKAGIGILFTFHQMKQRKIIKIYEHQFSPGPAAMVFGKNVTIANANVFSGGIWAIECKFQLNNTYLFKNKRGNNPAKFSY